MVWAGPEVGMFEAAKIMYAAAEDQSPEMRRVSYESIRNVLDRIVADYPSSDIAVRILLRDTIDGVDVAAVLDTLNEAPPAAAAPAEPPPPETAAVPEPPADIPEGAIVDPFAGGTDVAALPSFDIAAPPAPERTEEEIVTDIQAELNRIGCDAGPVDGVAGRKTSGAYRLFARHTDLAIPEEDLVSEEVVAALRLEERPVCSLRWAMQNVPAKLAGGWGFRSDCPGLFGRVRLTGSIQLRYSGNGRYDGTLRAANGRSGRVAAEIRGNRIAATLNVGGIRSGGTYATSTRNMTMSGRDSGNCDTVIWKN